MTVTISLKRLICQSAIAVISIATTLGVSSIAQAVPKSYTLPVTKPSDLPEPFVEGVLQQISISSTLPISNLQIVGAQRYIWYDGCMDLGTLHGPCTTPVYFGWVVTIQNGLQRWVYHTYNNYNGQLARHYLWDINPEENQWLYQMQNNSSLSPANPILWNFQDTAKSSQYNFPKTYALRYTVTSNASFTGLYYNFSTEPDFNPPFTVSVENNPISQVTYKSKINSSYFDFSSLANGGIQEFTITNINPAINLFDAMAFPLYLTANDIQSLPVHSFSYKVEVLQSPESASKSVPEPTSIFSLLALGIVGFAFLLKRKQQIT